MGNQTELSCRYCRKFEDDVVALLAFPDDMNICDECVWLMVELLAADYPEWRKQAIQKMIDIRTGPRLMKGR